MKYIRYGRYTGEPADSVDLQELMKRLSDFLLQSGFESQFYGISEMDPERSMENLRQAILRALQDGDLLPDDQLSEEMRELLQNSDALTNQQVRDLIDQLVERLTQEGYISPQPPQVTPPPEQTPRGHLGGPNDRETHARFEITDKALDFLGDRKSTRLNSSHLVISYAVFCLKKKTIRGRGIIRAGGAAWYPSVAEDPTAESAVLRRR